MTRNRKIIAIIAAILVVLGVVAIVVTRDSGDSEAGTLIVPRKISRQTLADVLTINGELEREELRKINSPVDGRVSSVFVDDGEEVNVGDPVFALDGRTAVAVPGDFSFFRSLNVGSDGPDVFQLEQILAADGYSPGPVDRLFTEQTRSALTRWQLAHGYGGATPEPDETVNVSLQSSSAGYDVGKANTIGITIGPTAPASSEVITGARLASRTMAVGTPDKPIITVSGITPSRVEEGQQITVNFKSEPAPASSTTIDLGTGGDATGGAADDEDADYAEFPDSFVFPAGKTTFSITRKIFVDEVVEPDEDLSVELSDQFGGDDNNYVVGPISEGTTTIVANGSEKVPVLTISSDNDVVAEGDSATFTIESDVELGSDLDINISSGGFATPLDDFEEIDDEVTLTAGNTEVDVTLNAREDQVVEADEFAAVAIEPGSGYIVGSPSSAGVTISSEEIPEMTLIGGGRVSEGGSITFTVVADQAVSAPTSINYQLGGTADSGEDYEALSGTVLMPQGARSVTVTLKTIDDDVLFQPSDMLVANWPARVGKVEVDEGEFVLQGAVVLTLTEPRFKVKLKVSATDRSKLEVGQEVTVDLDAAGQTGLEGVITQLDENATVTEASGGTPAEESYEGVVELRTEPKGVDGATASIDVTLSKRDNVIAVPVAAVLESGGKQEVRVINDAGKITRVTVETGLVDDDFIEITKGLKGDELVIVSVETENAGGTS
jgi:multidrug efflux pump subunit AcrA (membrane-fusion protein)/peptidoglycan hydrolase-like protein with peptidoglycan-binding domain